MKLNRYFLLALCVFSLNFSFAQKSTVNGNKILVDGNEVAQIEKDGCGAFSRSCSYYISDLNDNPLITVIVSNMVDPALVSDANPNGSVRFLRFSFTGIEGSCEVDNPAVLTIKPKHIANIITKAKLIKDGALDQQAVMNFMQAHGNRFTERQQQLSSPSQTIIINNH